MKNDPLYLGVAELCQAYPLDGERYAHWDDATSSWWIVTRADVVRLGRMVKAAVPDAYSVWCSETSAEQQPGGWDPREDY